MLKNKTILITGGTGTFGNALVDKLLIIKPKKIIIFSRDEKKQDDMRNKYKSDLLHFIVGDLRDAQSVNDAFYGVDYVIHAGALKQVPSCEINPMEAYKTNVIGSYNVFQSAINNKVKKVIILSTDKAVFPINAYGMSKAMMEKLMLSFARRKDSKTIFCGVRYGNVLYSRGSVIPLFIECIKKNKQLEITNPHMTRFLLPLPDAVKLVMKALNKGKAGDMLIMKSSACTIETLAKALCELFKFNKGYRIVGQRIGEKIHETLIDSNPPFTSENAKRLNVDETKKLLLTIPEVREALNG